jgi:flagella basal body P-ring formation protein FlgA
MADAQDPTRTAVVARLNLAPGTLITSEHLGVVEMNNLAGGARDVIDNVDEAVGRVTRVWISAGHIVRVSQLRTAVVVRAGTVVTVRFEGEGLIASAEAKALEAGGVGDAVRVRNIRSGLIVLGRVRDVSTVLVSE